MVNSFIMFYVLIVVLIMLFVVFVKFVLLFDLVFDEDEIFNGKGEIKEILVYFYLVLGVVGIVLYVVVEVIVVDIIGLYVL